MKIQILLDSSDQGDVGFVQILAEYCREHGGQGEAEAVSTQNKKAAKTTTQAVKKAQATAAPKKQTMRPSQQGRPSPGSVLPGIPNVPGIPGSSPEAPQNPAAPAAPAVDGIRLSVMAEVKQHILQGLKHFNHLPAAKETPQFHAGLDQLIETELAGKEAQVYTVVNGRHQFIDSTGQAWLDDLASKSLTLVQ